MRLNEDQQAVGEYELADYSSPDEMNIVCPWHGIEFDLESGTCISDKHFKLRKFETSTKDGRVYIHI